MLLLVANLVIFSVIIKHIKLGAHTLNYMIFSTRVMWFLIEGPAAVAVQRLLGLKWRHP